MIEQVSTAVKFLAFYTETKVGKTGLTVTVDVRGHDGTEIVTAGSATEIGDGLYSYTLSSGSTANEGAYVAVFKTATSTVDQQHIPSLWCIGVGGVENLNATVSSRASQTSLDTVDDFLDTEVAAIKAKTDNLPSDPADASDIAASFTSIASTLTTIATYIDTEVAAIKAKTDNLPAAPAATGDIPSAATIAAAVFARTFHATKMSGLTFEELAALIACAVLAKCSGMDGVSPIVRNVGDTANAITGTADADGNRTAVTLSVANVR